MLNSCKCVHSTKQWCGKFITEDNSNISENYNCPVIHKNHYSSNSMNKALFESEVISMHIGIIGKYSSIILKYVF